MNVKIASNHHLISARGHKRQKIGRLSLLILDGLYTDAHRTGVMALINESSAPKVKNKSFKNAGYTTSMTSSPLRVQDDVMEED